MRAPRNGLRLAWGIAGVAIGILLLLAVVTGAQHGSSVRHRQAVAVERVHFWRIVDGSDSADTSNIAETQLALDLKKALGAHNPDASGLPPAITGFYGDSNLYGPARSALGFNPFTGASGPLTGEMKNKLLLVKRGQVETVVASEKPADNGPPIGWTIPLVLFVLWLAAGLVPWVLRRRGEGLRLRKNYPEEYRLCRELKGVLKELEPETPAYLEAHRSLDDLMAIMRGDESLEAKEVLRQAREQIEARRSATAELEQSGY